MSAWDWYVSIQGDVWCPQDVPAPEHAAQAASRQHNLDDVGYAKVRPGATKPTGRTRHCLRTSFLDGGLLRIPPEKMKNARWGIVPVSGYVADILATCAEGKGPDGLLFPARDTENQPKGPDNLSRSYRSVVRRLDGFEWSSLYDLRHFFASQLAKHGATEQQIGRLLCHVGQTVTSRYVHQDIEDLRHFVEEHAERVRAALGGETPSLDEESPAIRV